MTPTLRLEPLGREHLDAVRGIVADPAVQRFTRVPVPPPPDFAETWIRRYEDGRAAGTCEGFAIVDALDGGFLGLAFAPHIDAVERTIELGYVVDAAARGRGIARTALALMTDWALAEKGALRLELMISVANDASKRVARSCGYVREGVLRSRYVKPGVREDTELWSLLPGDPREPS